MSSSRTTGAQTAAGPATVPAASLLLPTMRRVLILIAGMLAMGTYFTSILIASTVLPQMQGSFSATADEISWSVTFNILATAIAMPMTGWASVRFGRWRLIVYATALFTFSTLMCGLASSLEEMIFWRVVQGAAGAPSVPMVQAIVLDTFPPSQHRVVLGIQGMGVVLGPIFGPLLGGMLAEAINWRWAFYLLVPVGGVAAFGMAVFLPKDAARSGMPFRWTGFILLSLAVGGIQLMLARGERLDWFESTEIVVLLFVSCLAFYLFVVHSLTSSKPFLDLRLLLNRNYALGLGLVTLFGMLNFTPMVLLPPLLRTSMGYSDVLVGQVVASRGLGGVLGFFAVMFLDKLDPRVSVALGFILQMVAGYWLMHISLDVSTLELVLNGSVQGFSSGIIVVALTLLTFESIPRESMPEASSIYHLLRNIGASLFISISVAEVLRATGANYARLSQLISPYNKALWMPSVSGPLDLDSVTSLERMSREIGRQSAMLGYLNAVGLFTAVSAVAIPLILMMRGPAKASR